LSLTEVSTFLGLTERAKDRVLITNCDEIARDVKNRDYLRSIRGQDFDLLEEADFELIEAWLKEKPVKRELPKPKPYQLIALEDIKKALVSHDRATAVMACGTGKTLIALWAAEQSQANIVLVLLPSLTLMQQTLLEWSKNNSWGNRFSFICVCSDPTVKANDEIEIDPTDIDFKVDTDPELVKQFLNQKNNKVKVVFSTYQSSKIVGEAIKGLSLFDFAIFDEAHKTTGPKGGVFAYALDDQNISIKKRLFLTATPRHYDIKKRDKEGEFKVISMDDESIYGPRAHSLTFGSAASQGIICNYKVIISLIDKNQVDDFALKNGITLVENDKIGTRWVASQIALQQAIEKVNASKIITFHSRVKLAKEFSSETSHGIKRYLKEFEVMHVNGEQRSNERTALIRQFKDSPKSLITNARCLTEGVDVPAVDMVAFIDARHSKVDIAQAIGRAMRKPQGSDKQFGYIVVPLFADTSDLNNLEETIKKEGFDDVAEILNALQEQDEELVDIIRELQEARGRGEIFNPKRLSEKIETIGPFINLDEISNSVYTEIVNQLGISWDFMLGIYKNFKMIHKTSAVPRRFVTQEGFSLGLWVGYQRLRQNKMSRERFNCLSELGFIWDPLEAEWREALNCLCKYYDEFKHISPARNLRYHGINLSKWISVQRGMYRKGEMIKERIIILENLSFWIWDPFKESWDDAFKILSKYYSEKRTTKFPLRGIYNNFPLGIWLRNQRIQYFKKRLSNERILALESFPGWAWDELEYDWNEMFMALLNYVEKNKLLKGFIKNKEGKLNRWVKVQRNNYRKGILNENRKKKLESIPGWTWIT
jgi:superfamily II DNA or RNA helicase